jgi:cytochrome c
MPGRRAAQYALLLCGSLAPLLLSPAAALAQMSLPSPKPVDGATLFKQQCAVCHTLSSAEPMRQGPALAKIVGRRAGSVEGFRYSAGFAKADFTWDEAKLDAWLTNPQELIPGAVMAYRQAKPDVRAAIINYLKDN